MIKNFIAYHKYMFKINIKETITLVIDLVIFSSSLVVVFNDWKAIFANSAENWFLLIVLASSFAKFLYDSYNIVDKVKDYLDLRYGEVFNENMDLKTISISKIEAELGYEAVECRVNRDITDYVINSIKIDNYIKHDLVIEETKQMEKTIDKFIKSRKVSLMPFLKWQYRISKFYGKDFFNERKLCLSKDIIPNEKGIVHCHKGSYYDTYLTNIICGKQLRSNQDDSVIANAIDFFPSTDRNGILELNNITCSLMNNEIGISTIGITSDNYLVIWTQNRVAQSSNGLLVPTGSGSCNWEDQESNCFNRAIINAMKRELWEESGKKNLCSSYRNVGETIILGFFRWIVKGGKPEFVGLTKMNCDLISLYANKREVYGRREYHLTKLEDIASIVDEILSSNNISVPLYMNLLCLRRYNEDNGEVLEKLIFG